MSETLSDEDRRAVDFVLNGESTVSAGTTMYLGTAHADLGARIQATETLLALLDALPVFDPPDDLLARTMKKIETAGLPGSQPTAPETSINAAEDVASAPVG